MENKLLILGLLLSHEMHGYQLYEVLKQNPGTPISLKKPNTYKLLGDMEEDSWVTHFTEQEGNRPPRQVYSVTKKGEKAFKRLLRENLSSYPSPEEVPQLPYIDKVLHFAAYAVLGALFFRAFRTVRYKDRIKLVIILSILSSSLYGVSDELHQYFVPFRNADVIDIVSDVFGSICGVYGYYMIDLSRHAVK